MRVELKYIGGHGNTPATVVDIIVEGCNVRIRDSITKLDGMIEDGLIENLKDIVEQLEEHEQQTANQTFF